MSRPGPSRGRGGEGTAVPRSAPVVAGQGRSAPHGADRVLAPFALGSDLIATNQAFWNDIIIGVAIAALAMARVASPRRFEPVGPGAAAPLTAA